MLHYHQPARTVRYFSQLLLYQPATRINYQSKAFSITAPAVWNCLQLQNIPLPSPLSSHIWKLNCSQLHTTWSNISSTAGASDSNSWHTALPINVLDIDSWHWLSRVHYVTISWWSRDSREGPSASWVGSSSSTNGCILFQNLTNLDRSRFVRRDRSSPVKKNTQIFLVVVGVVIWFSSAQSAADHALFYK